MSVTHLRDNIIELRQLSINQYEKCKSEWIQLSTEEHSLEITPLGELECYIDDIAGVVFSICNGHIPLEHFEMLKSITIEKNIPNIQMIKKYPLILEYLDIWEKLKVLCINLMSEEQK